VIRIESRIYPFSLILQEQGEGVGAARLAVCHRRKLDDVPNVENICNSIMHTWFTPGRSALATLLHASKVVATKATYHRRY